MLIKGTPSMLAPPTNPLGFSGLSLSGSLGYVDSETPRTQYTGAPTDWDIFRDNLFFGNRALRDDPAHPANIFGSYYDPRVWGSTGTVQLHQRDLLAHWKRVLSMFAGATWNDGSCAAIGDRLRASCAAGEGTEFEDEETGCLASGMHDLFAEHELRRIRKRTKAALDVLKDQGILTEDEFAAKKAELLKKLV